MNSKLLRRVAQLTSLALVAPATAIVVSAGPASACVADEDGDCWHPNYQVWRADSQGLAVWTGVGTGSIVGWLPNGSGVEVVCQTNGPTEDGLPYTVWDHMDDGNWVYDYYVTTPGDGYHIVLTHC
jgi:hypothetical protein